MLLAQVKPKTLGGFINIDVSSSEGSARRSTPAGIVRAYRHC
jgi:hypothetical protein